MKHLPFAAILLVAALNMSFGQSTRMLPVTKDNCLWELDSDYNLGTQRDLPAGTLGAMGQLKRCRLLFQVDLDLPAGATVVSANYRVLVTMQPATGRADSTFSLHRWLAPWSEGEKRGDLPGGQPATDGESTWATRAHPDTGWSEPGGAVGTEYAMEPSAGARVTGLGEVVFAFNEQGLADLSDMAANPAANHGWVMITQEEEVGKTARRFAAREHRETPPMLEVTFEGGEVDQPPFVATIEVDAENNEWVISAPAGEAASYTLQCSSTLESNDWKNEEILGEFILGRIVFRKLMNEEAQFARIIAGP